MTVPVLSEYLRLYGRDRILILFQEYLYKSPDAVMPDNLNVHAHRSGEVRFKVLSRLAKEDSIAHQVLRAFMPRRLRPTIVFGTKMFNIRPLKSEGILDEIRRAHGDCTRRRADFLEREIGLIPPWPVAKGAQNETTAERE